MITKWGVALPESTDLPALPKGVVMHWTGGGPRANSVDLAAYHFVVETDGNVRQGKHPVAANMRALKDGDEYAKHTGDWNSFRVGLSAAGMRGYKSRAEPGDVPLTTLQVFRLCELAGYFCELGNLDPSNPRHLCTHQEVWTIHGVKGTRNHQKTDIEFLPFAPEFDEHEVGPHLRHLTAELIAAEKEIARPKVEIATLPEPRPEDDDVLRLDRITVPKREHIDAILRVRRLSPELAEDGLRAAEVLLRGVLAGQGVKEAALKAAADALSEWLKDQAK